MHCPQCGAEASDGANFCRQCGTELGSETETRGQSGASQPSHENDPSYLPGLDVEPGTYTAEHGGGLTISYRILDETGQTRLTAEPDWDGLSDALSTIDLSCFSPTGEELFRIVGQQVLNVTGGEYALVDSDTEQQLLVLSQEGSLTQPAWNVYDDTGENLLLRAQNQSRATGFARNKNLLRRAIPCEYAIETPTGQRVGSVTSEAISANYEVEVTPQMPAAEVALVLPLFIQVLEADR